MKSETDAYVAAAGRTTIEPRYVVVLSFDDADTDLTYLTSHDDALDPGGVAAIDRIDGAVISISGITQAIKPDKASHSIGNSTLKLLDVNGEISTKIKTKLDGGESLRKKRIQLYKGESALGSWSDYSLQFTFLIDAVKYKDGTYTLTSADIQRSVKQDIFTPHQGALTATISATDTSIPITIPSASSKFPLVAHDSIYTSNASATVGYIKIDDEIICHSGWNGGFTELTVVERGALNTKAKAHEVTATETAQKKKVDEFFYLEMPAPKLIYALLTGVLHGQGSNLPDHWHLGISTDYVELTDFTGIGDDLWNTTDNTGRIARFIGLEEENAKEFIEEQLLLWLSCFTPVYANGKLGLVRLQTALPYSAYDAHLGIDDVVSHSELTYDQQAVINNVSISWNWIDNLGRFSKINTLIDADSIAKHGTAKQRKYEFKGVFTGVHSDEDIRNYFRSVLNRYSGPPLRLKVKAMPQWDRLEVGDTIRLTIPTIWDYHIDDSLDRVFEIQGIKTDWITGLVTLDLFGGVEHSTVQPVASSNVMQDSFYTATGTELSTVLTISGGAVTASGSLTGGAELDDAVYYYDGDLTINSGVTVTMSRNTKLLVKGFLTINGDLDITGVNTDSGYLGKTNSGRAAHVDVQERANDDQQVAYAVIRLGYKALSNTGQNEVPEYNLLNPDGLSIQGLPTDLTGRRGVLGQVATMKQIAGVNTAGTGAGDYVAAQTSTRGAGGGGLLIISRGGAIGGSGSIITDSESGGLGSSLTSTWTPARIVHSQRGASGFPGGVLWLLDGNYSAPVINSSNFSALRAPADPPAAADEFAPSGGEQTSLSSSEQGYGLVPIDNFNYFQSCSRIQYLPNPVAPFDWLPADEEKEATGYENKPPGWSEIVDDGGKPNLGAETFQNSVVFNASGNLVANDGRPAGVKSIRNNTDPGVISYQDTEKTIVRLYDSSDDTIAAGWPAFKITPGVTYTIFIRIKSDAASGSGFYFRMAELDSDLSTGKTHIGEVAGGEAGVEEGTRTIATFRNDAAIGTAWEEYEFTYTPTSSAKWAAPEFLNWTGMGLNELHIDTCLVTSNANLVAASNLVLNGDAELGNNTNFSTFRYQSTGGISGAGCFELLVGDAELPYFSDNLIPVNPDKIYLLRGSLKTDGVGLAQQYLGFACFDESGNEINTQSCWRDINKNTTLFEAVGVSDQAIKIVPASEDWFPVASPFSYIQFDIQDDYSDLPHVRTISISDIDKSTEGSGYWLLSLSEQVGEVFSVGAKVGNSTSGATYNYALFSALVPINGNWNSASEVITGQQIPTSLPGPKQIRFGTKYVKMLTLFNSGVASSTDVQYDAMSLQEYINTDWDGVGDPSGTKPTDNADQTSINTALNTSNVGAVVAPTVAATANGVWANGLEPAEFAEFLTDANNTIAEVTTDKFSGSQSMRITSTALDTDSSGVIGATSVVIDERIALGFAGKKIRIAVYAKTDDGASFFQAAYSTDGSGDSGWRQFELTSSWKRYTFDFDASSNILSGTDNLGFQSSTDGSVLIDNIIISLADTAINAVQISNWVEQTNPKAGDLKSVAFADDIWFAVGASDGADAYMIYSLDGSDWSEQSNPKNFQLNKIAHGNGVWVAVGAADGTDAYVITAPESATLPLTFTERSNPKNASLNSVAYGNGIWVAVGFESVSDDAYIITATDPTGTWTERTNPKTIELRDVTYAEGLFVAVGSADGTDGYIVTSPDGISWTERTNPRNKTLRTVCHGDGLFVAGGLHDATNGAYIITSPDGVTWTEVGSLALGISSIEEMVHGDGIFVGVTNGLEVVQSADGVTWKRVPFAFDANTNRSIAYSGDRYVIVGDDDGTDAQVNLSLVI